MAGKIIIYPPALFEVYEIGKNANFLLPLIYKKKPMRRNLVINLQSHIHNMLCVVELSAYPNKIYSVNTPSYSLSTWFTFLFKLSSRSFKSNSREARKQWNLLSQF